MSRLAHPIGCARRRDWIGLRDGTRAWLPEQGGRARAVVFMVRVATGDGWPPEPPGRDDSEGPLSGESDQPAAPAGLVVGVMPSCLSATFT